MTVAHTFLILLYRHLAQPSHGSNTTIDGETDTVTDNTTLRPLHLNLAPDAQPEATRMPDVWKTDRGDGRARGGRDRVWVVADVVLAIKVGASLDVRPWLMGPGWALGSIGVIMVSGLLESC